MKSVVYACPCGGKVDLDDLTCTTCHAMFAYAPPLLVIQRGRDDIVVEGIEAKRSTERVGHDNRAEERDAPTVR